MTTKTWIIAGMAIALVFLAIPRVASAERNIAFLDIEGERAGTLRRSIEKLVRAKNKLISARQYRKAAGADGDRLTPSRIARVAARAGIDGVLVGNLTQENGTFVLRLRLHAGKDGKSAQRRLKIKLKKPRLTPELEKALKQWLDKKIDGLPEVERVKEDREDRGDRDVPDTKRIDPPERPIARTRPAKSNKSDKSDRSDDKNDDRDDSDKSDDSDDSDKAPAPRERKVAEMRRDKDDDGDDDDDDDNDSGDDDDEFADMTPAMVRATYSEGRIASETIQLAVGSSFTTRTLAFSYRGGLADPPKNYESPLASGVYAVGEFYPLARAGSAAGKFGIAVDFDRVIGLKTAIDNNQANLADTTVMRFGAGIRFRQRFGQSANRPTIKVGVGAGQMMFTIDRSALMGRLLDVPDTKYTFVNPGLSLRVPIGNRVALDIGGSYLLILGAGPVTTAAEYGKATLTGFDAGASFEIMATRNILVRLAGSYTSVAYDFDDDAVADQSNNRDGNPDKDVFGALDRKITGNATLGYKF